MDSKYLPSKSFVKKVGILLILVCIVILVVKVTPFIRNKIKSNNISNILVKDIVENDSNRNGIQDWEEKLWGLDPEGDGPSNKAFINAKKKNLPENTEEGGEISENDQLSREFFALVMSLGESGASNEEILAQISAQIGDRVTVVSIPNKYESKDITRRVTSKTSVIEYRDELTKIMNVCQKNGIGSEMDLISTALNHENKELLSGLTSIEKAYGECILNIQKVKVPMELTSAHLSIMNNFEKSAQLLKMVETIFENQIAGLSGIVSYNKYNALAIGALNDIRDYKLGVILTR